MALPEINILHDKMQEIYDRGQIGRSPKNYFPTLCEFGKELATNPLLEDTRQAVADIGKQALVPFRELKISILHELNAARETLAPYKTIIPGLAYYLDQCDCLEKARVAESWELAFDMNAILLKRLSAHQNRSIWRRSYRDPMQISKTG